MKKDRIELSGVLGSGVKIKGELYSENDLRFDGNLEGTLVSRGELVMGSDGFVDGTIVGGKIQIAGRIKGEVIATGHLEILDGASIDGNVFGLEVCIREGSKIQGQCAIGEFSSKKINEMKKMLEF
jgi:cytoskeletal protein CcmA (bactofilin family)